MTQHSELKKFVLTHPEAVFDAIGDAISIQDKDLRILYQNKAHISMMGNHPGEYCYAAYQGKNEPCPDCHLLQSFKDDRIYRYERSALNPERGRVYVEIVSSPFKNDQGEIIGGIEMVRDITDRVLMEEKLIKHVTAMETSMDGIAILNNEGSYTFLNQAHAAVYGYNDPAELIGKSWQVLYDSDELNRFQKEIFPLLMQKRNWRGEAVGRKKDGTSFPQELSLTITADDGFICVVRDISERKSVEERLSSLYLDLQKQAADLKVSNSELESFSYTLSHDVRSYLTRISLASQALQENHSKVLGEAGIFLLQNIGESCEGMENLIQAILLLSRVNKSDLVLDNVDLSELAIEVGNDLRFQYPEQQVDFTVFPGLAARGNRDLLKIMLLNLLGNAWKYTTDVPKACVTFGIEEHDGKRVFFVRDNGAGFDMHEADKLFKPFSRLDNTADYTGVGIGLATVQRIIDAHGGEVFGEGEPGKGATFYFTLP